MLIFSLAVPVIYAIFGFIFTVLFCWIYSTVAKFVGGIEFILEDAGKSQINRC
jgi:hypothetical protein